MTVRESDSTVMNETDVGEKASVPAQYRTALWLEQRLGDPRNPDNAISFKRAMELDEAESHPDREMRLLFELGLQEYYIPVEYGGRFRSYEEFLSLGRALARRDFTLSICFSTLVWSGLVWLGGTERQKRKHARFLLEGLATPCLAYSEEEHGSDLQGGDTRAEKTADGYRVTGEKWPINRATLSGAVVLLARTGNTGTSRDLSLFVAEKRELDPASFSYLPKVKTLGLRGCDISGIRFDGAAFTEEMRMGPEGSGLELALKGFQITRILCASLSLGAADTSLRTTLEFALDRRLYGKTVFDIPHARGVLGDALGDILMCDCVSIAAARAIHVAPDQLSVWSAVVKYFVPTAVERMIAGVSVVFGSRFFMREKFQSGIFQKMLRDNGIVGLFDGSTVVNLQSIVLQLRALAKAYAKSGDLSDASSAAKEAAASARRSILFDLERETPKYDPSRLDLFNKGLDDAITGLAEARSRLETLHAMSSRDSGRNPVLEDIIALTDALIARVEQSYAELGKKEYFNRSGQSPELFESAKEYCALHSAAVALHMWLGNRETLGRFFREGAWLAHGMAKLIRPFVQVPGTGSGTGSGTENHLEALAREAESMFRENRSFSIISYPLPTR